MPDNKITVLVTAFGPFESVSHNVSQRTLEAFRKSDYYRNLPSNVEVITQLLDVDLNQLASYGKLIQKYKPTYVIALGHAVDSVSAKMRYEAYAANIYSELTNTGNGSNKTILKPDAPGTYFGVKSKLIFDLLKKDNDILQYGYDSAGMGMCNAVYYEFTHEMEKARKPNRTIFLHLDAPAKVGGPGTFSMDEHQQDIDQFAAQYAASLEKMISTMNKVCHNSRTFKMLDPEFMETFIPAADTTARNKFLKLSQKDILPK